MLFGIGQENLHIARRVQLVIWLQILQCWSGIAGITMYAPSELSLRPPLYYNANNIFAAIFQIAGFASQKALWISGLNNIFYAFATLICVVTLDRIGRRWTLWWGAAGQAAAMFLAGGLARGGINNPDNQEAWGIGATVMVYLYTFVFGATWLIVPWLYPAEIFPLKIRAKGNAWGVVGWSVGNGYVPQLHLLRKEYLLTCIRSLTLALPYVFSAIGANTMYVFGAVNLISIPIGKNQHVDFSYYERLWLIKDLVWAFYPESSQRTLEEIDMLFAAKSPFVWAAESNFETLITDNPKIGQAHQRTSVAELDKGMNDIETMHEEDVPRG